MRTRNNTLTVMEYVTRKLRAIVLEPETDYRCFMTCAIFKDMCVSTNSQWGYFPLRDEFVRKCSNLAQFIRSGDKRTCTEEGNVNWMLKMVFRLWRRRKYRRQIIKVLKSQSEILTSNKRIILKQMSRKLDVSVRSWSVWLRAMSNIS